MAIYNYIFWFNPYQNVWYAIQKDDYLKFFNGHRDQTKHYKSKEITTLVEIISKPEVIKDLK